MTALIPFDFEDNLVRIHDRDGTLWFVAKDVCAVLGIRNHRDAIAKLDDDERDCVGIADAIGRERETAIISEPGFYRLCSVSRKPEAKRFIRWVNHEVLPAIRKTGRYDLALPAEARAYQEWSIEELRAKVALVTMYRRSYGNKASRWMAAELGFPKPPASARRVHQGYDENGEWQTFREDEEDEL